VNIGNLPSQWKVTRLGDVARIVSGGTPDRSKLEYWNGNIPWVKTGEINYGVITETEEKITQEGLDNSSARIMPVGTTLMAMYGQGITRGRVAILGIDSAINQACAAISINNDISTDFLFYFLTFSYDKIRSLGHGANQKNLNSAFIRSIEVILPPLPEQRAIAHTLRTIQKAKEARQRELELERERKAALMQYLFTHGTRNEPQNWKVVRLGEISKISSGGTPSRSKPEYWNGDIPWVKTGEITYGIIQDTEEKITQEGLKNSSAKLVKAGTLLMAMYGQGVTRGRVAILGIDATINQACAAISTLGHISTDFLFYFLSYNYEAIRNLGHGANQKNLNADFIKSITIKLPNYDEQCEIADILRLCDKKITAIGQESTALDELFRAMLEEMMTGHLSALPLVAL
jgi:type I restriction enzyme S subunit